MLILQSQSENRHLQASISQTSPSSAFCPDEQLLVGKARRSNGAWHNRLSHPASSRMLAASVADDVDVRPCAQELQSVIKMGCRGGWGRRHQEGARWPLGWCSGEAAVSAPAGPCAPSSAPPGCSASPACDTSRCGTCVSPPRGPETAAGACRFPLGPWSTWQHRHLRIVENSIS